jgi:hypothetical protein
MPRSANTEAITYTIRVQGVLDRQTAAGMGLFSDTLTGADAPPITTLIGVLSDEAALGHVLDELYARSLPLISVEREEIDRAEPTDEQVAREAPETAESRQ